jgi:hypothetical protein
MVTTTKRQYLNGGITKNYIGLIGKRQDTAENKGHKKSPQ